MAKNHLKVTVDPLKMKCGIMGVKSPKTGAVKKCLIFPIDDNDFYNKIGEDGKIVIRMTFDVWENDNVSQYGDTHMVKFSHSKEWNESHSDEDRRNEPILGNARPILVKTVADVNVPTAEVEAVPFDGEGADDLPF